MSSVMGRVCLSCISLCTCQLTSNLATQWRRPCAMKPNSNQKKRCQQRYASIAEWLRARDTLVMMKLWTKAGGRELEPRPGHYSRMSF